MNAIYVLVLISLMGCSLLDRRPTRVVLEGDSTPTFVVSGTGLLQDLIVYGSRQRNLPGDRAFAIWEIQPLKGSLDGESLDSIGSIKYGVVPEGYKQVYPENKQAPPPLTPGTRYEYWFVMVNAPEARSYFEIRDNKAVVVPER